MSISRITADSALSFQPAMQSAKQPSQTEEITDALDTAAGSANSPQKSEEPAYELVPPAGYNTFDEYIRDWSAQNESKWKLPEPTSCVRDMTGYTWLTGAPSADINKYSGAIDFFMGDDLKDLSEKDYAKLQNSFEVSCNDARLRPDTSTITIRGCTMTMREFDAMYDALSLSFDQQQKVYEKGIDNENLPMSSNWLIFAQSPLRRLSAQKILTEHGVSADVLKLVSQRLQEKEVDEIKRRHGGFDNISDELVSRLLETKINNVTEARKKFTETIDWFKGSVRSVFKKDAYLSRKADQLAGQYANGLAEMIRMFNLS